MPSNGRQRPQIIDQVTGRDENGKIWVTVIADQHGRILAGRDDMGNFHLLSDAESLYEAAFAYITFLTQQNQNENPNPNENPNENGERP